MAGEKPTAVYAAMGANLAIAITKFLAAGFTGSSAMISEGIHSLADTGNQGLLLLGIQMGKRQPDESHPFGHGKEIYFWSLIVAIILFSVGGGMSIYEGITHLQHPAEIGDPFWNYVVLFLAIGFEGIAFTLAYRKLQETRRSNETILQALHSSKDPTVFVVLFEDAAALSGLIVALFGVFLTHRLNDPTFDGVASIIIGIILALVAIWLAYESKNLLIGEGMDISDVRKMREIVGSDPAVVTATTPMTMYFGPNEVLVNLEIQFRDSLSGAELTQAVDRIEEKIHQQFPQVKQIFLESESIKKVTKETVENAG